MAAKKKRPTRAPTKKPARAKAPKKAPAKKKAAAPKRKAAPPRRKAAPPKRKASPAKKAPAAKKKPAPKARPTNGATPQAASEALARALRGHVFDIALDDDCADEAHRAAVDVALENFRAHLPAALLEAEGHVFLYYLDCKGSFAPGQPGYVEIASPKDVWKHVHFGPEATVGLRAKDGKIYVSLECSCDWEEEHGLQIVLEEGRRVNKVGPFDGHVTNADAYADTSLEGVVYKAH
jgi:hypothetical protein